MAFGGTAGGRRSGLTSSYLCLTLGIAVVRRVVQLTPFLLSLLCWGSIAVKVPVPALMMRLISSAATEKLHRFADLGAAGGVDKSAARVPARRSCDKYAVLTRGALRKRQPYQNPSRVCRAGVRGVAVGDRANGSCTCSEQSSQFSQR